MVFSQTSLKTHNLLKVVDLDRLNGSYGVVTDLRMESTPSSPVPSTSSYEEFLKPESMYQSTMNLDSDAEFFQDLIKWCDAPVQEAPVQSIDPNKTTETGAHTTDTQHTPFSPQGWDIFDANSSAASAVQCTTTPPSYPESPSTDVATYNSDIFGPQNFVTENKILYQEQFLDIGNLPVVIGDLASENMADVNLWSATESVWQNTHGYTKPHTTHTLPFIDQDDSLDMKMVSVIPREVESNEGVISEYIINDSDDMPVQPSRRWEAQGGGLAIDVTQAHVWSGDVISTPDVLTFVEQLEKEKSLPNLTQISTPLPKIEKPRTPVTPPVDYEPITPKSEPPVDSEEDKSHSSKRSRHDSEESDETYSPYAEQSPRKYKRRKPTIPIKDMIRALEGSQQLPKARRGRPPKRRDSVLSNISENSSSVFSHEMKYRELRDKNNEASKRSRMNRKLKELQMEQLASELEERNKKLRVRADLLEDMTKKLREAFMAAVSQKKAG
ncbi:uncharacterized protein LOC126966715 [Leptidea sinapis]|uniref:uncharacterized protein LOC126966715 n=1 Tax=Leptidea sinapis TaxID=189913 RepID=UPI002137EC96|nr:uncharacterized protein LOC126966715 [Leptidea sinapis]XP_050666883.1 uncharacterized protein LOC126966715 [Leptidea sinapis]